MFFYAYAFSCNIRCIHTWVPFLRESKGKAGAWCLPGIFEMSTHLQPRDYNEKWTEELGWFLIYSLIHSLTCLARYLIFSYFYLVPARVNLTKGESWISCIGLQVNDILQHYPDLMEGFNEFLEHCENIGNLHLHRYGWCNMNKLSKFLYLVADGFLAGVFNKSMWLLAGNFV